MRNMLNKPRKLLGQLGLPLVLLIYGGMWGSYVTEIASCGRETGDVIADVVTIHVLALAVMVLRGTAGFLIRKFRGGEKETEEDTA